jgi:hypothetical protein
MNRKHLVLALAALLPLTVFGVACSRPSTSQSKPASTADSDAPTTIIGRHIDKAMEEARKDLETKNISIGDHFNLNVNGKHISGGNDGLPKAEITPQGDLLIDGKAVAINPVQRTQLLQYRGHIIAIAEAGMAIGSKGADLASKAVGEAIGAIFSGDEKGVEARMETEGKKIEAEAIKLCTQLPPLLTLQQQLAASLPAFKPYATMTRDDIDDCGKDVHKSMARGNGEVRSEIQQTVRDSVRESVRSAVRVDSNDSDTETATK